MTRTHSHTRRGDVRTEATLRAGSTLGGMLRPGSGLGVDLGNTSSGPRRGEKGATLVEFAVVAPLLLLLLFGVIEFGRAIATYTAVATAAREAARYGTTVGDNDAGAPRYFDCDGIRHAAREKVPLIHLDDSDIDIAYDNAGVCAGGTATEPFRITVTVSQEFHSPIPLISNITGSLDIRSSQTRTVYPGSLGG